MREEAEQGPPEGADHDAADHQAHPLRPGREQPDQEAEEETPGGADARAGHRRTSPREPTGDALHQTQVGADDVDVLDRKAPIGEAVDRPLRLGGGAIARHALTAAIRDPRSPPRVFTLTHLQSPLVAAPRPIMSSARRLRKAE